MSSFQIRTPKIDAEAFKDKGITGVEIPDSIITIENNAFAGN